MEGDRQGSPMAGARTLQRGLEVLAAVGSAEHELSVTDVARVTGLDRAVISRLLPPLLEAGFIVADGSPPKYRVGPAFGPTTPSERPDDTEMAEGLAEFLRSLDAHPEPDLTSWRDLRSEPGYEESSPDLGTAPYFDTQEADDAYAALMSFVGGMRMSRIAERAFGADIPYSFVARMGDVRIDSIGPDYATIVGRMCDFDPAAAFRVFYAELSEREQDILRDRLAADPETLDALGERHGLTRERVRQLAKNIRQSFDERLRSNALMIERVALARADIGGIVDMRKLRSTLLGALPMVSCLAIELDEVFFFLLFPEKSFSRSGDGSSWFVDEATRRRLADARSRAVTEGMPSDEFLDAVPAIRALDDPAGFLATIGLQEVDGEFAQRNLSMNERTVRLLRRTGSPISFDEIVEILRASDRVRGLRNALLAEERIARVDRDLFALAEWGLPAYSTVRELIRQEVESAGGQADIAGIKERLTARFDVKASSVEAYAKGPEFVRVAPGVIRLRGEGEDIEDMERPLHSLRGCVRIGRRWALRVEMTRNVLKGFSVTLPRGMGPHFGVPQGESEMLRTDRAGEVSVVRRGLQDSMGRLRWVAEELSLGEGDVLFVLLPERKGGRISFSGLSRTDIERANPRKRAGMLLGYDDNLSLVLACSALGMPRGSRPAEVADRLRSRGEDELAALVGEVLGEGASTDVDTSDIARMLGFG